MANIEDIQALQEAVGPKRIKTTDMEVEQFELKDLIAATNQQSTKKPSLSNIGWTRAVPKYGCSCPNQGECRDS